MTQLEHIPERREITLDLLRKRSEHNEHQLHNLEELALHQENLTHIGNALNRICGKTLKILLLQNNVIESIGNDLRQCRSLEYLNLALNNLTHVRGLQGCEFLNKLDLTLNFISVTNFASSLEHLSDLDHLRELYLLGNPSAEEVHLNWKDAYYRYCVINALPQLCQLDGVDIKKSERIAAHQQSEEIHRVLLQLVEREALQVKKDSFECKVGKEDLTGHSPGVRAAMSRENAQQLVEKERNENTNKPKFKSEQDIERDHASTLERIKALEEQRKSNDRVRMKNEGKWTFAFDEDTQPGFLLLTVNVQKHLSTSLIDVDIHPWHVTIVIKSKILRLVFPVEVKVSESKAERSTTTGALLLRMPKFDPRAVSILSRGANQKKSFHKVRKERLTTGDSLVADANKSKSKTKELVVNIQKIVETECNVDSTQEMVAVEDEEDNIPPPFW